MDQTSSIALLANEDYEAITDAVMETARGRWFLTEFGRRNRTADTEMLLEAINKMQSALSDQREVAGEQIGEIRLGIMDMASAIAQTKREIAAIVPDDAQAGGIEAATAELDAIVQSTETATTTILEAAEKVQETAWNLREDDVDAAHCDTLDNQATEIYTACSFQDITGQRTEKIVAVLRFLEQRLSSMMEIWDGGDTSQNDADAPQASRRDDAHLLNGPQLEDKATDQDDIDLVLNDDDFGVSNAPRPYSSFDPAEPVDVGGAAQADDAIAAAEVTVPQQPLPAEAENTPLTAPATGPDKETAEDTEVDTLAHLDSADRSALFS